MVQSHSRVEAARFIHHFGVASDGEQLPIISDGVALLALLHDDEDDSV